MSKRLKSFLISLLVGVLLCAMVIFINRDQGYGLLRQLCDGCFVAAVLLLGAGVLRYVTNQGAFDVLGYGLQSVFHLHIHVIPRYKNDKFPLASDCSKVEDVYHKLVG